MKSISLRGNQSAAFAVVLAAALCAAIPVVAASYTTVVLTADQAGVGAFTDANLRNAWGISYSSTGDFWISDNNNGLSTLYDGTGKPQALVVTIPAAAAGKKGTPTGTVFNSSTDFKVSNLPSVFLFVTEDGTISGWDGVGTVAIVAVNNSAEAANYKGA